MYARLVNELPEGKELLYEVKFDGYRCLAGRDSTGVTLWSRRGNLRRCQFCNPIRDWGRNSNRSLVVAVRRMGCDAVHGATRLHRASFPCRGQETNASFL